MDATDVFCAPASMVCRRKCRVQQSGPRPKITINDGWYCFSIFTKCSLQQVHNHAYSEYGIAVADVTVFC